MENTFLKESSLLKDLLSSVHILLFCSESPGDFL